MTRRWLQTVLVVALLVLVGAPIVVAQQDRPGNPGRETRVFGELNGYQETPSTISTTGFGELEAMIDDEAQTIVYTLTYTVENAAIQAHIHLGARNTTGGVAAFLCGGGDKRSCPPLTGTVEGVIDAADVIGPLGQGIEPGSWTELVRAIRAGVTYANVHTQRWPGGEIRGQLNEHGQPGFVD